MQNNNNLKRKTKARNHFPSFCSFFFLFLFSFSFFFFLFLFLFFLSFFYSHSFFFIFFVVFGPLLSWPEPLLPCTSSYFSFVYFYSPRWAESVGPSPYPLARFPFLTCFYHKKSIGGSGFFSFQPNKQSNGS